MKTFTAKGYVSTLNYENVAVVEGSRYILMIQDVVRIAQAQGIKTDGKRCDEFGINGVEALFVCGRDGFAELAKSQPTFCVNVI